MLQEEGTLGAPQTVQNDFQHGAQDALTGLRQHHRLHGKVLGIHGLRDKGAYGAWEAEGLWGHQAG